MYCNGKGNTGNTVPLCQHSGETPASALSDRQKFVLQLSKRYCNREKTHQPIKKPLPPVVLKVVKPVFDRLGNQTFLAGCEDCETQNPNESLHHVIWGFTPKEQYTSAAENDLAVSLGVLVFNSGMDIVSSQLIPMVDLSVTPLLAEN